MEVKGQQPIYQPYTVAMVTALYSGCWTGNCYC